MNKYKIMMNRNGNKVIKISPQNGKRGFSIETNGNLKSLHNEPCGAIVPNASQIHEIKSYIYHYDNTPHKAEIMNVKEGVLYHI